MSDSSRFSPSSSSNSNSNSSSSSKSQTSTPQGNLHTCEPSGTSCQQMAESQGNESRDVSFIQHKTNGFSMRTGAVNGQHNIDGTISSKAGSPPGRGSDESNRFHPYRRQFSEGEEKSTGCVQQCSPSFSRVQEEFSPNTCVSEPPPSWDQYNNNIQNTYSELPAGPVEPSCFLSQSYPPYSSVRPQQQVSSRLYLNNDQSNTSKYPLQSLSAQSRQESTAQTPFPKPIYSYSILIFMALKSSKTGSLPVSEIYSFMTEHFPYFKTAPDGWKNSVRHNLSLNKCFEKVENKNGNSSRKGCLWALNPAKVEKMQEELRKWRRKDPITVRRSMAKPEDLDCLLGERPEKLRSLPPYPGTALIPRVPPISGPTSPSCSPPQLQPPCQPIRHPHYIQPQQPCYLPNPAAHPGNAFALYSPCGQQPTAGIPSAGGLNSPMAGKMPPVYESVIETDYGVGPRSVQDFLSEAEVIYDIDTLNPSLTDLQLQGNMWEELREENMASYPQVTTAMDPHVRTGCLQVTAPVSHTSEVIAVARCKAEYEGNDSGSGRHFEQHGYLNGLHPMVYSGVESLAGYLTTTSISLM